MKTLNHAQIEGMGEQMAPVGRTARIFSLQVNEVMLLVEEALNGVFKTVQDQYGKSGDISPALDARLKEQIRVVALTIAQQVFDAPTVGEKKMIQIDANDDLGFGEAITMEEFFEANTDMCDEDVANVRKLAVGETMELYGFVGDFAVLKRVL